MHGSCFTRSRYARDICANNKDELPPLRGAKNNAQIHPPLPSSSSSSTARMTRAYSSARQGSASGRAPTCSACIARNHGSVSVGVSPRANAPAISGGGASMTGRRARARMARFECGVGAASATRLRRGVVGVEAAEAARRRLLEGVRGVATSSSSSSSSGRRIRAAESTPEDSPSDLPRYSPSLSALCAVLGSSLATFRRRFETGWTATIHGAPEPHSTPSALARWRDCSRWLRQSSS